MSRPTQALATFLFFVSILGCSVSHVWEQLAAPEEASETEVIEDASNETVATPEKQTAEDPAAQLRALADQMADEDPQMAILKLRAIFAAAKDDTGNVANDANILAILVASRTPHKETKQYAQRCLIFSAIRGGASDAVVFDKLKKFFKEHQSSIAPIDLYRALADELTSNGDGSRALRFLDHGIRTCATHPRAITLTKHRQMTQQTMMLMGHTRNASINSNRPKPSSKSTAQAKTLKAAGEYAKFFGKKPRIAGRTLQGRSLSPSATRGEWTYVHFWATWCGACRKSTPSVVSLQQRYEKKGVKFVGVNLDSDQDAARKFIKQHSLNWSHLSEETGQDLAQSLGVNAIPVSLFLSPDGTVVSAGKTGSDELKKQIEFSMGFDKGLQQGLKYAIDRIKKQSR